jgi:diacylglycerol kinase (ATP)
MAGRKKILFIINPISGVGKKNKIPGLLEKYLNREKFDWEIEYTQKRKHGAEITKECRSQFDAIVAVGGDGSVNEIGSELINHECALGILPCGSGNGLARHLKIPLDISKAIQRIGEYQPIKIDTGKVNDKPFLGTCGFGFDAHVAHKFDTFGKRGLISYIKLVISEYAKYEMPTIRISGKDFEEVKNVILCSVANSAQFGNGFTISPNSDIQDGIFELVFLERFNWIKSPIIASKFFSRSIHTSKYFSRRDFSEDISIKIETSQPCVYHIDGEPFSDTNEFKLTIEPKSLTVI